MKKFPIVVLSITLVLVLVSIVLTFIGAFSGESGLPLFKTGLVGIIFVPIFGWLMAASYNRIHRDDPPAPAKTPDDDTTAGFAEDAIAADSDVTDDGNAEDTEDEAK